MPFTSGFDHVYWLSSCELVNDSSSPTNPEPIVDITWGLLSVVTARLIIRSIPSLLGPVAELLSQTASVPPHDQFADWKRSWVGKNP